MIIRKGRKKVWMVYCMFYGVKFSILYKLTATRYGWRVYAASGSVATLQLVPLGGWVDGVRGWGLENGGGCRHPHPRHDQYYAPKPRHPNADPETDFFLPRLAAPSFRNFRRERLSETCCRITPQLLINHSIFMSLLNLPFRQIYVPYKQIILQNQSLAHIWMMNSWFH